jgi:hypothetical protein
MATSGVANRFQQDGWQIALHIPTEIIMSYMSLFGTSIPRTNLEIMSLLRRSTHAGTTTHIERSAMPTPVQPIPNSRRAMFTRNSTYFNIFPVL